jgi:hypothetical protein
MYHMYICTINRTCMIHVCICKTWRVKNVFYYFIIDTCRSEVDVGVEVELHIVHLIALLLK